MNNSDIKLLLFREIDKLPAELLLELKEIVLKISSSPNKTPAKKDKRQFGSMKGLVVYMSPDFNAPLDEFKDYMPA